MVFSSITFLFVFLPVVFLLERLCRGVKAKNALLLAASLLFYAYGEPVYVLLMLGSILANYLFALWVGRKKSRLALVLAVVFDLGALAVFKYAGFAVSTVNTVFRSGLTVPQIALPIGISFFTFQALSYVIDVYRGQVEADKNLLNIALYISFFPQLIAGPIVKYHDVAAMLRSREETADKTAGGLCRFTLGLAKKVLIANTLGACVDSLFALEAARLNVLSAWLAAVCYVLQIYYDFSGYSDMAIGLGRIFGFGFKENFLYPYAASSMRDFWRRWHVSMSTWFKEYLYIPLGGNRKGKVRTGVNKVIVFFCTGLWHGASWTFVIWGLWHGLFLLLENAFPKLGKMPRFLGRVYTMLVVTVGFTLFRSESFGQFGAFFAKMFAGFSFDSVGMSLLLRELTPLFIVTLVAAVLLCGKWGEKVEERLGLKGDAVAVSPVLSYCVCAVLLVVCVVALSGASYNPFIYFRF